MSRGDCATLNNGMMTTHDDHVPSIISGSGEAFEGFVTDMVGEGAYGVTLTFTQ